MFLVLVFLGGMPGGAPVILAGPAVTPIDVPGATATFANGINSRLVDRVRQTGTGPMFASCV